jgi:UDP-glucose 4-epimerase
MERVLVTGGAGFIGSHLVDWLVADGQYVNVLDDFSTGCLKNLEGAQRTGAVEIFSGSVLSTEDIRKALAGCGSVYHLAVKSVRHSLGNPIENHLVNATGTLNVLQAARKQGVRRFVYCSSSEVYGNAPAALMNETTVQCQPVTVYGAAKRAGELYADAYWRTYRLPTVILRPFNAYGPRAHVNGESGEVIPRFVARVLNGLSPIVFGDGNQTRDFTYVTEIARAIGVAGKQPGIEGRTLNIGYGKDISIRTLAETIIAVCGPPDLTVKFRPARPGDVASLRADTAQCQAVLGFKPQVSLLEGLSLYIAWLRRSHQDLQSLIDDYHINWTL